MTAARPADDIAEGGLAGMLAELIDQNLTRDPARRRFLARPLRVVIEVPDARVRASVRADGSGLVEVRPGDDPTATVRVRADGMKMLGLAAVPLWAGLPDVRTADGRVVVRDLASGAIRVRGLFLHLRDIRRLLRVLSAR